MSRLDLLHKRRLQQLAEECTMLAGNASRIAHACDEAVSQGGIISVQPQVSFIVSTMARLMKDVGVIEQMQSDGVSQRPPIVTPRSARPDEHVA